MAAKPKGLDVSPALVLPLDAVTQTFALLAVRRAGKSNAGAVTAEEMYAAGLPFVVIDPKGDWWGLRSAADGKGKGLPVPIFGGLHGDMQLTPGSGAIMAALVVGHNLTCILDVSRFSKADRARFLTAFGLKLYELHQADPQPRHLFLEEADRVVPQQIAKDAAYMAGCVGAFSDIVRLGGAFGLGVTLISQRSASVNKDVLTQVETMIAMRTTSPQDRKVIKDWMEHHAIAPEIVESLPGLLSGEAWVSSSWFLTQHGQEAIQRIRFRQRWTFDSGATPKVGQQRKVATLADIDLGAITAQMAEVTEEAEKNDPAALRRKVAQLERHLARAQDTAGDERVQELAAEVTRLRAEAEELRRRPPEIIEVPVLTDDQAREFLAAADRMAGISGIIKTAVARVPGRDMVAVLTQERNAQHPPPPARPAPAPAAPAKEEISAGNGNSEKRLGKAERAVLTVLAHAAGGRTKNQVAVLSGYSVKSSTLDNALSGLRVAGFINRGAPIVITDAGIAALGDDWEPLPEGTALVEYWMGKLGRAERIILRVLLDAFPGALTKAQIAEASGYAVKSSTLDNALSRLRVLELAGGYGEMRADETLAQYDQAVLR